MGWEKRRGRRVYYRKVREGGRVRSIYCGTGERGEQAAREDEERRRGVAACSTPPEPERSKVDFWESVAHAAQDGPEPDYSNAPYNTVIFAVLDCITHNRPVPPALAARRRELEERRDGRRY